MTQASMIADGFGVLRTIGSEHKSSAISINDLLGVGGRAQIAFGRASHCDFSVGQDVRLPPAAVDVIEGEWFDSLDDVPYCRGSKRNKIWIASHEADVTAILHHGNDVAREQRAFAPAAAGLRWPMQHSAAFEMSAAVDQCEIIPERKGCSFPKLNTRSRVRGTHDPFAIGSMQKYLRVETFRPFDHRRVKVRMRNRDRADTAARVHLGNRVVVEESDAIPEQISSGRLQKQSTLAYRKFRFGADPQKAWRFFFQAVVMISRQPFERRPFLASVTNKLPFISANGTAWRRPDCLRKLRSALHADKIFDGHTF